MSWPYVDMKLFACMYPFTMMVLIDLTLFTPWLDFLFRIYTYVMCQCTRIYMLNKNSLAVKKVQGQSEAAL